MKKENNLQEDFELNNDEDMVVEAENPHDNKFVSMIQKNSKIIMVISLIIVVVVAGLFFMQNKKQKDSEQAGLQLSRIMSVYEQGDFEKALSGDQIMKYAGLKSIANNFDNTDAGKLAALYAGNSLMTLNKASEAAKYFEIASSADSKLVQIGSLAGLAGCDELNNKLKEAAEKYEKASTLSQDDNIISRYKFYAGLCLERISDKVSAEKCYREVLKINKTSEFALQSKMGLARIGMIIE